MNKIFTSIYNRSTGQCVVASELAKGKKSASIGNIPIIIGCLAIFGISTDVLASILDDSTTMVRVNNGSVATMSGHIYTSILTGNNPVFNITNATLTSGDGVSLTGAGTSIISLTSSASVLNLGSNTTIKATTSGTVGMAIGNGHIFAKDNLTIGDANNPIGRGIYLHDHATMNIGSNLSIIAQGRGIYGSTLGSLSVGDGMKIEMPDFDGPAIYLQSYSMVANNATLITHGTGNSYGIYAQNNNIVNDEKHPQFVGKNITIQTANAAAIALGNGGWIQLYDSSLKANADQAVLIDGQLGRNPSKLEIYNSSITNSLAGGSVIGTTEGGGTTIMDITIDNSILSSDGDLLHVAGENPNDVLSITLSNVDASHTGGISISDVNTGAININVDQGSVIGGVVINNGTGNITGGITNGGTVNGDLTNNGTGNIDFNIDTNGTLNGGITNNGDGNITSSVGGGGTVNGDLTNNGTGQIDFGVNNGGTLNGDVTNNGGGNTNLSVNEGGIWNGNGNGNGKNVGLWVKNNATYQMANTSSSFIWVKMDNNSTLDFGQLGTTATTVARTAATSPFKTFLSTSDMIQADGGLANIRMSTNLGLGKGDLVSVDGAMTGRYLVDVTNYGVASSAANESLRIIRSGAGSSTDVALTGSQYRDAGMYRYYLTADNSGTGYWLVNGDGTGASHGGSDDDTTKSGNAYNPNASFDAFTPGTGFTPYPQINQLSDLARTMQGASSAQTISLLSQSRNVSQHTDSLRLAGTKGDHKMSRCGLITSTPTLKPALMLSAISSRSTPMRLISA
jgi:Pertactin/Extended Signal Peptide of Type V secretion system